MERLTIRLRNGAVEPIQTELDRPLLDRIRGLEVEQALRVIVAALPEKKQPYGQAMLATLGTPDSVVEMLNLADEEVVTVARHGTETTGRRASRFADLVARAGAHGVGSGRREARDVAAIEIGAARLARGGMPRASGVEPPALVVGPWDRNAERSGPNTRGPTPEASVAHPLFRAARSVPFLVLAGETLRLRPGAEATLPQVRWGEESFGLQPDLTVAAWDGAFFEDHEEQLDTAMRRLAEPTLPNCGLRIADWPDRRDPSDPSDPSNPSDPSDPSDESDESDRFPIRSRG